MAPTVTIVFYFSTFHEFLSSLQAARTNFGLCDPFILFCFKLLYDFFGGRLSSLHEGLDQYFLRSYRFSGDAERRRTLFHVVKTFVQQKERALRPRIVRHKYIEHSKRRKKIVRKETLFFLPIFNCFSGVFDCTVLFSFIDLAYLLTSCSSIFFSQAYITNTRRSFSSTLSSYLSIFSLSSFDTFPVSLHFL